jgi:hypothetical protein
MMCVGGALSIDKAMRMEGYNWWANEELNHSELLEITDRYISEKPRIMVTHECPEAVAHVLFGDMKIDIPSITRQAFESMWENHKPEMWIFGHWHVARDQNIMGTRFICLPELGVMELNI